MTDHTDQSGLTEQEYQERHDHAIIRPPGEAPDVWIRHDYIKTAMLIDTLNVLCDVTDDRDRLDKQLGETLRWLARAKRLLTESCDACEKRPGSHPLCSSCLERRQVAGDIAKFQEGGDA